MFKNTKNLKTIRWYIEKISAYDIIKMYIRDEYIALYREKDLKDKSNYIEVKVHNENVRIKRNGFFKKAYGYWIDMMFIVESFKKDEIIDALYDVVPFELEQYMTKYYTHLTLEEIIKLCYYIQTAKDSTIALYDAMSVIDCGHNLRRLLKYCDVTVKNYVKILENKDQ